MEGDFNIAVAQFGQAAERGIVRSATATKISNSLFHFLDGEYQATDFELDVEVTHKNIPIIQEGLEAERLAKRVNADIVIYGSLHADGDSAELYPRFFVFDKPDTGELTGPSELAHPISFELSELGSQDDINTKLRTRAAILVSFTKGLVYAAADNHGAASHAFQQAVTETRAHDRFEGEEVLYLLLAVAKRKQQDWDGALENLDQALALNPDYARAYIGRGNVYYAQAIIDWSDTDKLDQARREYEQAASVQAYLPGAYIEEKVNVALGNVYLVQAQQTGDTALYAQATRRFEAVTTKYEDTGNERLMGLAATAYFGLGAAYERQRDDSAALRAYESCIQTAEDDKLIARCKAQSDLLKDTE
jgi:tetratricopeptide (TPR) repeat protein